MSLSDCRISVRNCQQCHKVNLLNYLTFICQRAAFVILATFCEFVLIRFISIAVQLRFSSAVEINELEIKMRQLMNGKSNLLQKVSTTFAPSRHTGREKKLHLIIILKLNKDLDDLAG